MNHQEAVSRTVNLIREKLGNIQAGTVGLVLGSGLGPVADALTEFRDLPYAELPELPQSTVKGHGGFLRLGLISGRPALALCGRVHLYEGYGAAQVCLPVRVLAGLGLRTLVLTNAAGALNPDFAAGSLMLIRDHMNFTGQNPLTGPNVEPWGPRFPDLSRAWDPGLLALAARTAEDLGLRVEQGVYVQVPGPSLETPAETRAYRRLGADAIGMSTALEAVAARHMGLRILGLSCLTNANDPDHMQPISHEEVLAAAGRAAGSMARLLAALAARPEFAA